MLGMDHISRAIGGAAAVGREAADRTADAAGRGMLAALDALLESELAEKMVDRVIESPAAERLVGRVIQGPLLDEAVARLLESEDLWLLVDVIARSPAVTDAISTQGRGFADQVAGVVRRRSLSADDRLETVVRGLVRRRRPAPEAAIPPPVEP
jgi:hypothetical protein